LLARIIQASTPSDAWIMDPFSGSATTGIAANLLNRNFLGLELEDEFLKMGMNRRLELDKFSVRQDYVDRLVKAHIIPEPLFEPL
jgi:site-specific DNA-methyltransferase (adenine-specific)